MANQLFVEKGFYEKGGNKYSTYFVKGTILGKELKATVIPPDKGGYQLLDLIFGNSEKKELNVKPFEMKTDSGETIKGNTLSVSVTDEEGNSIECKVVPAKFSDKQMIQAFVR